MLSNPIKQITSQEVDELLSNNPPNYRPLGLFYHQDGDKWVGIENSCGHAWTEEFNTEKECFDFLLGKEE